MSTNSNNGNYNSYKPTVSTSVGAVSSTYINSNAGNYNNYKPETLDIPITDLDALFEQGALKLLSKIETESVGVQIINAN